MPEDGVPARRRFALSPAAAFAVVGAVVLGIVLQRAFVAAHRTIGWAAACGVVALLLDPVVQWLDRRLPRVLAILASLFGLAGLVGIAVFGVVRQIGDSLEKLSRTAPEAARRLEQRTSFARELELGDRVAAFVDTIERQLQREALARVGTAPTYVVTGILMLFFLAYGRRYLRGGLQQISDPVRRADAARRLRRGLTRGRNSLLLTLAQVVVVTLIASAALWLVDLPTPFVLGLLIGMLSSIPYLGVLVGGIPALLLAFGFNGAGAALIVLVLLAALQALEGLWVRPSLDPHTVSVGPLAPLAVAFIGFELYGPGGAVYGYALIVLAIALFDAATIDEPDACPILPVP